MKFLPEFRLCCGASSADSIIARPQKKEPSVAAAASPRLERRHSSVGTWRPSLSAISEVSTDLSYVEGRSKSTKHRSSRSRGKKSLRKSRSTITYGAYGDSDYNRKSAPSLSFHSVPSVPYMF